MIRYELAEPRHAALIARSMRARDIAEVAAGWGKEPTSAILDSLGASYYARIMFYDLEPLIIYGLTSLCMLSMTAQIWLFGTRYIDDHPLAFCRASKVALRCMRLHAQTITNLVDVSDLPARKWLEWLGGRYVLRDHERGGKVFRQFMIGGVQCPLR